MPQRAAASSRPIQLLVSGAAVFILLLILAYLRLPAPAPTSDNLTHSSELTRDAPDADAWPRPSSQLCQQPPEPPMVCAHGGDTSNGAPPGTLAAFRHAAAAGLPCIEVDAAETADGRLVVLHTRQLQHLVPNASRQQIHVWDLPWSSVQQLRWPGGERVPLVAEVLAAVSPGFRHITIDLKPKEQDGRPADPEGTTKMVAALLRQDACPHCLVWSKSDTLVAALAAALPGRTLGYVAINETAAHRAAGMHRLLRLPQAQVISMHHAMASAAATAAAHAAGKAVHVFTCNTRAMLHAALEARADALVTDHPHQVLQVIAQRQHHCKSLADEL